MKTGSTKIAAFAAALLVAAATAQAQTTTVFSETWQGATGPFPKVVNGSGSFVSASTSFQGDKTWTADPDLTEGLGAGPHVAISLVENAGDVRLEWNADNADGADNDVAFSTAITSPFKLEDVDSVTLSADIEVRKVGTNSGRDSTFYIGADINNYFTLQLVTRNSAGTEVIEVEWARDGADNDTIFGDGAVIVGGGEIVPGGKYSVSATFTPTETSVDVSVLLIDQADSSTVLSGTHSIPLAEAPALDAVFDTFFIEGKRRMYHTWGDVTLQTTVAAEGEGEGVLEGEGEGGLEGEGEGAEQIAQISGTSVVKVGENIVLTVNVPGLVGNVEYAWARNGQTLSGQTEQTLQIVNATVNDSGSYVATVTDESAKAVFVSAPFLVTVTDELPLAGGLGLAALAALLATAGAGAGQVARRRK